MLSLQASNEVSFQANTLDELEGLVDLWLDKLNPVLFGESEPDVRNKKGAAVALGAPTPANDAKNEDAELLRLGKLYSAKTGKRFNYRASGEHAGKTRLQALREAVEALGK